MSTAGRSSSTAATVTAAAATDDSSAAPSALATSPDGAAPPPLSSLHDDGAAGGDPSALLGGDRGPPPAWALGGPVVPDLLTALKPYDASVHEITAAPRDGGPARALAAFCRRERATLLVLASRGRGALGKAVLGSVSEGALKRAPCPLLILRPAHAQHVALGDSFRLRTAAMMAAPSR